MLTMVSAFALLERDQLAERTRAGMAAAALNGGCGPAENPRGAGECEANRETQNPGDQARRCWQDTWRQPRDGLEISGLGAE